MTLNSMQEAARAAWADKGASKASKDVLVVSISVFINSSIVINCSLCRSQQLPQNITTTNSHKSSTIYCKQLYTHNNTSAPMTTCK